jgi:hypothetical protein
VKAGRVSEAIHELPTTLHSALGSVTEAARAAVSQLRTAGSDEIEVEFGVDLAVEAGVVITKSSAQGHLKVTVTWKRGEPVGTGTPESSD